MDAGEATHMSVGMSLRLAYFWRLPADPRSNLLVLCRMGKREEGGGRLQADAGVQMGRGDDE